MKNFGFGFMLFFSITCFGQDTNAQDFNRGALKIAIGSYLLGSVAAMQIHNESYFKGERGSGKQEHLLNYCSGVAFVIGGGLLIWGFDEVQNGRKIKLAQTDNGVGLVLKF